MPKSDDPAALRPKDPRRRPDLMPAWFGAPFEGLCGLPCMCRIGHTHCLPVQRNEGRCSWADIQGHGRNWTSPSSFVQPPSCATGRPRHAGRPFEVRATRCEGHWASPSIRPAPWRPTGPSILPQRVHRPWWRWSWLVGQVGVTWGHGHDAQPKREPRPATEATWTLWATTIAVHLLDRASETATVHEGQ